MQDQQQSRATIDLGSVYEELKKAARRYGILDIEEDLELYLGDPRQLITPIVFGGTFERYAHWTFGKRAEQHEQAFGLTRPYRYPDIFIPSRPNRAFLAKHMARSFQVAALARFIAYMDFCDRNINWWKVDYTGVWHEVQEHAHFVSSLLNDSNIDPTLVTETLTAAHAIAPQSGHTTVRSGESSDLLKEIAAKSDALEDWQRELLLMVRKEWLWFLPEVETGLMMRGWAAFWQNRLLREVKLPKSMFVRCMVDLSNTLGTPLLGQVNTILLAFKIFEHLHQDHSDRVIHEIVAKENDASFVEKYLTQDVAIECGLFSWGHDEEDGKKITVKELSTDSGWEKVRDIIVRGLSSNAFPAFQFIDSRNPAVYKDGIKELRGFLLVQNFEGRSLDDEQTKGTGEHIAWLTKEPVYVLTVLADSADMRYTSCGLEYQDKYKEKEQEGD